MPDFKTRIISVQQPTDAIDVNNVFRVYKYARQEHLPIKLSNGMWLHTYRVTEHDYDNPHGDEDYENDCFIETQF
jgi:hypothetical protein